jgi:hypothetical protein
VVNISLMRHQGTFQTSYIIGKIIDSHATLYTKLNFYILVKTKIIV